LKIHSVFGAVLIAFMYFFALAYGVAKVIDPVRTREWELKYWWRLPPGSILPKYADPELLASSLKRRIQERLGAAVLIGFLLLMAFVIVEQVLH